MSESTARPRNLSIEALRLVAIAGIAIFHTFQPWFAAATDGTWQAGAPALAALGCVSLLGAYGNNVFFLISGMFLVPRAADASSERGYWRDQAARSAAAPKIRSRVPITARSNTLCTGSRCTASSRKCNSRCCSSGFRTGNIPPVPPRQRR